LVPRIALVATTKVVGFARRPMPVGIIAVIRPQLGSWGSQAVYRIWSVPPSLGEYAAVRRFFDRTLWVWVKVGNKLLWLTMQITSNYQICSSPDLGLEYWSIPYSPPRRTVSAAAKHVFAPSETTRKLLERLYIRDCAWMAIDI
jgi:hypothetical protein